jgi:predicted ribosomally synthesized peptide with SipW-like signal peptide
MKRLLISALIVLGVGTFAIGATLAFFTDQEEVLGNTIQTGSLDFDLRGDASTTFTLTNLVPGGDFTTPMRLDVYNQNTPVSTVPIKYRFYDRFGTESVSGLYNKMNVIVRHTFAGTSNPEAWPIVYQGKLKNMVVDSTSTPGVIASTLGVNITHVYYLQFQLDSSAGNQYQNANATFDIVADATQSTNPTWTE